MTRDTRDSYRIPAPDHAQEAVLQTRRGEFDVRLVDESAGGFAVATQGQVKVRAGDRVKLSTYRGWSDVEVTNQRVTRGETRIGLRCHAELPERASFWSRVRLPSFLQQEGEAPTSTLTVFLGILLWGLIGFWCYLFFSSVLSDDPGHGPDSRPLSRLSTSPSGSASSADQATAPE